MPKSLLPLLLACFVSNAAAQEPDRTVQPSLQPRWAHAVWAPISPDSRAARDSEPLGGFLGPGDEDHRYEGFFVGAGLGIAMTLVSLAWCEEADNGCNSTQPLVMGAIVTGMLGSAGGVLGGLLPK